MSELKAKDCPKPCPLCAADMPAVRVIDFPFKRTAVSCRKSKCGLYGVWIDLAQWNTRPREEALEDALLGARSAIEEFRDSTGCEQCMDDELPTEGCKDTGCEAVRALDKQIDAINSVLGKGGE